MKFSDLAAPLDVTPFRDELAIKWANGAEFFLPLRDLRLACPCAICAGERDLLGITRFEVKHTEASYQLRDLQIVGGYALQPIWQDGHSTGIYTWKYLRALCEQG